MPERLECKGPNCKRYCEIGSAAPSACVFNLTASNHIERSEMVDDYFYRDDDVEDDEDSVRSATATENVSKERSRSAIQKDIAKAKAQREEWQRIEGPFDVIPGVVKGITVKKYH